MKLVRTIVRVVLIALSCSCNASAGSSTDEPPSKVIRITEGNPTHTFPIQVVPETKTTFGALKWPRIEAVQGVDSDEVDLSIPLEKGEALWGFGERFDALNMRGRTMESWVVDAWGGGNRSYLCAPFFISSKGYGLFVNCTGKVRFDCGASNENYLGVQIPGVRTGYPLPGEELVPGDGQ